MPSLISHLSSAKRDELFRDLCYLNMAEFKGFCDRHSIPYTILIETEDGKVRKSRDKDRQKVVIDRIIHYLKTGKIRSATLFKKEVVNLTGLPDKITKTDLLYYGCYEKKNAKMIELLKDLTNGEFKNGAIARILCRDFWTRGEAPTFEKYAKAWLKARDEYSLEQHPEAAYLTDLSKRNAGSNWKELRCQKANNVLSLLSKIEPV